MKKQSGFTLLELLIAFVIGLIIIAATIGIYISTIRGSSDTLRSTRLNHDLDSALSLMVNDIRRAGYWGGAIRGADSGNNPFTAATTNIQIRNLANPTTVVTPGNCILYSYDADGDGVVDANEYYGFRWEGANIRMRSTGTTTTDCTDGTWETMNIDSGNSRSEKVEIDSLVFHFDDTSAPSKCKNATTLAFENKSCATTTITLNTGNLIVETRQVTITISAHMSGETAVQKAMLSNVKVRNDRIFTQP